MASHVVMLPPGRSGTSDDALIVRDGFSLLAFLVPPLWLLWRRLWLAALLALGASVALTALGEAAGMGLTSAALSLLVSLYVGLEGGAMRIAALRRRGWKEWGVVEASAVGDAEIRLLAETAGRRTPDVAPVPAPPAPARARPPATGPVLGLLDHPGRP